MVREEGKSERPRRERTVEQGELGPLMAERRSKSILEERKRENHGCRDRNRERRGRKRRK